MNNSGSETENVIIKNSNYIVDNDDNDGIGNDNDKCIKQIKQIQCTNCKVFRDEHNFIGKSGDRVKRCLKCREKDDRQKKRPDIVEKRNERNKEKKYYVQYRENKRNENEEEYLKHQAEIAKKWRNNNKEHWAAWRTQNFAVRFRSLKTQAQEKGIPWNNNLTDEISYKMMTSNCHYCNKSPEESLNGIDRMNNTLGYDFDNCVSCCKHCNFIKGCLDPLTFIKRCQHISKNHGGNGIIDVSVWRDSVACNYLDYKYRANKKGLSFELSKKDFDDISKNNCYYCNKPNSLNHYNGIDRMNNERGYSLDNSISCCAECNCSKRDLSDVKFINICKRIADNNIHAFVSLPEMKACDGRITKREKQEIEKQPIVITKQQPNQTKPSAPPVPVPEYTQKQRIYTKGSNMPEGCPIKSEDIPQYCYYVKATGIRGDGFCCGKLHPKQKEKGSSDWTTTKSKLVSIEDKFKQLMEYIKS